MRNLASISDHSRSACTQTSKWNNISKVNTSTCSAGNCSSFWRGPTAHSDHNVNSNSAADCSISLKYGTVFHHVTADTWNVQGQRVKFQQNRATHRWLIEDLKTEQVIMAQFYKRQFCSRSSQSWDTDLHKICGGDSSIIECSWCIFETSEFRHTVSFWNQSTLKPNWS